MKLNENFECMSVPMNTAIIDRYVLSYNWNKLARVKFYPSIADDAGTTLVDVNSIVNWANTTHVTFTKLTWNEY